MTGGGGTAGKSPHKPTIRHQLSFPDSYIVIERFLVGGKCPSRGKCLYIVQSTCPGAFGMFYEVLSISILILFFEDMIQVTVKCDKRVVVFDGISKDVRGSDLLSMLEVRLGVKIPGNARLIGNGRFVGLGESIEEVIQILSQYLMHFNFC